jgi:(2Fe-2S) ferredoxin
MADDLKPLTTPRKRRIVLCMGQYCNRGGQAEPLYEMLRQRLGEPGPAWSAPNKRLRWEIANCLSMCGAGPNLVIYPERVDHHYVDEATLEAILQKLLREADETEDR